MNPIRVAGSLWMRRRKKRFTEPLAWERIHRAETGCFGVPGVTAAGG
jgi:hypothetical protein